MPRVMSVDHGYLASHRIWILEKHNYPLFHILSNENYSIPYPRKQQKIVLLHLNTRSVCPIMHPTSLKSSVVFILIAAPEQGQQITSHAWPSPPIWLLLSHFQIVIEEKGDVEIM